MMAKRRSGKHKYGYIGYKNHPNNVAIHTYSGYINIFLTANEGIEANMRP